jgi:hypothetical protein
MNTKEIHQQLNDVQEAGLRLDERISELENRENKTTDIVIPDYSIELNAIINELRNNNNNDKVDQLLSRITSIQETLKKQPVLVNKQWRILLFPETNQGQYYKIVFGRLIPWGLAFSVLTYIFIWGYKAIGIYEQNTNINQSAHYEQAWLYLQQHAKKKTIAAMDEAWEKTDKK